MPFPALARRVCAVVAGVVAGLGASPLPVTAAPAAPTQLNATDTLLLNGVRQAGLWELPAGQMAVQKGDSTRVRQIGQMIADQHIELDELTVDAANTLGATIPSTATAEQQGWLKEMQDTKGRQFDQTFVTRLRAAHGKIFPVISAVRSGTRNPVVRKLADQANIFVMNHMKMLESTGLVQYEKLPPAALPPAEDLSALGIAQANAGLAPPISPAALWTTIVAMLGIGAFASLRLIRGRRPTDTQTRPPRG
jgi:predicted outer membrane protein